MLSPTVSNRSSTGDRARASCEPCRTKKIRCSGEYPVCSKCVATGRECVYSMQKRAGRPKRPRNRQRLGAVEDVRSSEGDPENCQPSSEALRAVGGTDHVRHEGPDHTIPPYLADFESYMQPQSQNDSLNEIDINHSCACLSILYLLLNRLGVRSELVMLSDLTILRNTFERATEVLDCPQCPLRFSSVLQNATILGILCISIAESYVRFIKTIDAKAIEAANKGERLKIALNLSQGDSNPESVRGTLSVPVELPPEQWKSLTYRAVKSEIFGIEEHREKSFIGFIERLEDRQKRWHKSPTAPDCPSTYQSACSSSDELPLCLTIIKTARKVLDQIVFTSD